MSNDKNQTPMPEKVEQDLQTNKPKSWWEPWLDALLGAVLFGTLAALGGILLFDGEYSYQIGLGGAVLVSFITGLRGVVFYAAIFALMTYFFGTVF